MTIAISTEVLIEAAKLLEIETNASLYDIRIQYHKLLKKWHPDTSQHTSEESHQKTVLLNEAYNILVDYCMNFKFSFRSEDLNKNIKKNPADEWMERYGNDPIWN